MKKVFLLLLLSVLMFFSCGKDGQDGKDGLSYVSLNWTLMDSFGGFSEFPSTVINGVYYEHDPGTCSGWYISWDLSYWTVNYTIEINPGESGEEGGWFTDGEDGKDGDDKYYDIFLYSTGPSISQYDRPAATKPVLSSKPKPKSATQGAAVDLSLYDLSAPIKTFTIKTTNQGVIFTVEYKQYKKR